MGASQRCGVLRVRQTEEGLMKQTQILTAVIAALLGLLGETAHAAQSRTFADALKKAGKDRPVVMFCYGANYDKMSEKAYDTYIKKHEKNMQRVLNKAIYVVVPVYQEPDDKEKKEYERVMGNRQLPGGVWSIPCFAVVDGNGAVRGAVQSREEMEDPVKASEALARLLEDFDKQQKLLNQAEHASGARRQEQLQREALAFTDLRVPNHTLFDPSQNGIVEKLQVMTIQEANAFIRSTLAKGAYSPVERQMVMAAYAGHVRREKGSANLLRAIYTEMRNIAPNTTYGAYAEGAIELWVKPRETEEKSSKAAPPDGQTQGNQ